MIRSTALCAGALLALAAARGAERYEFGDPSPQEEWMRQLINGAREDPEAEADRLGLENTHADDVPDGTYDVGEGFTNPGVSDQADYWARYQGPRQPLAWSAALNAAARNHSDDMLTFSFFAHETDQSSHGYANGYTPADRGWTEGYPCHFIGENIATNTSGGTRTAEEVHVNEFFLEPTYPGRGHRRNLLHSFYREIGVGHVTGPPNSAGWTDFWTVDFGNDGFYSRDGDPWPAIDTVFVTGVVFDDTSGDGLYQPGEQRAGIRVFLLSPEGGSLGRYAVTASGGGYSVPLLDDSGEDLPEGAGFQTVFFDPVAGKALRSSHAVPAGTVVFEDTASETPDAHPQRLNVAADARTGEFADVLGGDANFDGTANILDLGILAGHYRQTGREWIEGDFSNDGTVNILDLGLLASHYRHTAGGASPVPEPAASVLLVLVAGATARRRRRGNSARDAPAPPA